MSRASCLRCWSAAVTGRILASSAEASRGVEADLGAAWVQVAKQDVEAVDPAGVLGDQVLAALGEQTHDRGVVLELGRG